MVTSSVKKFSETNILVVGDVMLDRYWFGSVNRISPEAPVPVVKIDRTEERLGGAANVARNAASLGVNTTLLSVIGDDSAGRSVARLLEEALINSGLYVDPGIDTTVKLRVIGGHQQLLRVDFETTPSYEVLQAKFADFEARIAKCDVVVLSDYGKGGLSHVSQMIELARANRKPVLVDPKGDDWEKYYGATVITPNRSELRQVVGGWSSEDELADKAGQIRSKLGLDALLVTRSEEGMTLFCDHSVHHQPARAREVFDVSGAGDTVIATLAAMLASGKGWVDAIRVANISAGVVVGKLGTAVVTQEELINEL